MDFEEFYAERVVQFDHERRIFREYSDLITPDRNEIHNLEWENRKLTNTAIDTQAEIERYNKEAKMLENLVRTTQDEIHSLRQGKAARNEQIMRLGRLNNPVQRDVTYIIEERFSRRANSYDDDYLNQSIKMGNVARAYKPLKTGELLKMEQRLSHETQKTTTYLQDLQLAIREAEEERHRYCQMKIVSNDTALKDARTLYETVDETEAQCFLAVSELLRLRVSIMTAQREEVEQLELLQKDKAYFIEKEEKTRQQLLSDMSRMQKRVKTELQESTRDFQRQLSELSVRIKALQLKEEWLVAEHLKEDSGDTVLVEHVEAAKKRYSDLRRRYALEMEGYETETAQLRARLVQVEKLYNRSLLNVSSKFTAPMSAEKSGPAAGGTGGERNGQKVAKKNSVSRTQPFDSKRVVSNGKAKK